MEELATRFAQFSIGLDDRDIAQSVRHAAQRAIVDTLGVMTAGSVHPVTERIARALPAHRGECSAISLAHRVPAATAALVNGAAAHAYDFDDTSYTGIMHGSAVILPALLAVAEEVEANGEQLLAAFVVASEVSYTLAEIVTHAHYLAGWWTTATLGLPGACAGVARLYGLDVADAAQAIGLAGAAAGGARCLFGTDAKPLLLGEAARRAVELTSFVRAGLSAPRTALDGVNGFQQLFAVAGTDAGAADSLGERWRLVEPGLFFKSSPVCSSAHSGIDLIARLLREADASSDDVVAVHAEIPALVNDALVYGVPRNAQQAQFSLPYALACAARHGRVRLQDLSAAAIDDRSTQAFMRCVTSEVVDELSSDEMRVRYPECTRLRVRLTDGREPSGFCGEAHGMPGDPLTDDELLVKFSQCVRFAGREPPTVDLRDSDPMRLARALMSTSTSTSSGRGAISG